MDETNVELSKKLLMVGMADCPRVENKLNGGKSAELTVGREVVETGRGAGVCIKDVDYGSFKASYSLATHELRERLTPLLEKYPGSLLKLEFRASSDVQDVFGARHTWYIYK